MTLEIVAKLLGALSAYRFAIHTLLPPETVRKKRVKRHVPEPCQAVALKAVVEYDEEGR